MDNQMNLVTSLLVTLGTMYMAYSKGYMYRMFNKQRYKEDKYPISVQDYEKFWIGTVLLTVIMYGIIYLFMNVETSVMKTLVLILFIIGFGFPDRKFTNWFFQVNKNYEIVDEWIHQIQIQMVIKRHYHKFLPEDEEKKIVSLGREFLRKGYDSNELFTNQVILRIIGEIEKKTDETYYEDLKMELINSENNDTNFIERKYV